MSSRSSRGQNSRRMTPTTEELARMAVARMRAKPIDVYGLLPAPGGWDDTANEA